MTRRAMPRSIRSPSHDRCPLLVPSREQASPARRSSPNVDAETRGATMSVTEFERHQLFSWFEEHMGQERATTIMNLLPPTGWGDVATRRDLRVLENRIDALEDRLNARIDTLEARLDAKLESRLGELLSDKLRTVGTWLFASQAAVIAVLTLLVSLLAILT